MIAFDWSFRMYLTSVSCALFFEFDVTTAVIGGMILNLFSASQSVKHGQRCLINELGSKTCWSLLEQPMFSQLCRQLCIFGARPPLLNQSPASNALSCNQLIIKIKWNEWKSNLDYRLIKINDAIAIFGTWHNIEEFWFWPRERYVSIFTLSKAIDIHGNQNRWILCVYDLRRIHVVKNEPKWKFGIISVIFTIV